jgi:hypothetical protein
MSQLGLAASGIYTARLHTTFPGNSDAIYRVFWPQKLTGMKYTVSISCSQLNLSDATKEALSVGPYRRADDDSYIDIEVTNFQDPAVEGFIDAIAVLDSPQ